MGIPKRTAERFTLIGKRLHLKGGGYSEPIKLPVLKLESDVLINPKDLEKFLTKIKREDLIINIPTYQRL